MLENDIKCTNTVIRMTMFDNVLNNPIAPLSTSNSVYVFKNLFNTRTLIHQLEFNGTCLILIQTILENILNNKTSSFSQGNFHPKPPQSLVDILHNNRWWSLPTNLQ